MSDLNRLVEAAEDIRTYLTNAMAHAAAEQPRIGPRLTDVLAWMADNPERGGTAHVELTTKKGRHEYTARVLSDGTIELRPGRWGTGRIETELDDDYLT